MSLLFPNPPLDSLRSTHQSLALAAPLALKFPRQVAPFAAVLEESPAAFADLHSLMEPGESAYVLLNQSPRSAILTSEGPYPITQMEWPKHLPPPESPSTTTEILSLTCANAAEMVALTEIAFPGYFRIRTCEMGPYFGIRSASGQLIAICGERMNVGDFHELSGLCTHPDHRGKGYAQLLLSKLLRDHHAAGLRSYLHAASSNTHAIDIYSRMGFLFRGEFPFYRLTRTE